MEKPNLAFCWKTSATTMGALTLLAFAALLAMASGRPQPSESSAGGPQAETRTRNGITVALPPAWRFADPETKYGLRPDFLLKATRGGSTATCKIWSEAFESANSYSVAKRSLDSNRKGFPDDKFSIAPYFIRVGGNNAAGFWWVHESTALLDNPVGSATIEVYYLKGARLFSIDFENVYLEGEGDLDDRTAMERLDGAGGSESDLPAVAALLKAVHF